MFYFLEICTSLFNGLSEKCFISIWFCTSIEDTITVVKCAWLLTLNEGLEVDMFSNRHMPDSPPWELQSEHKGVMVHLSLRHQHTIPKVESCKKCWCRLNIYPFLGFLIRQQISTDERLKKGMLKRRRVWLTWAYKSYFLLLVLLQTLWNSNIKMCVYLLETRHH